MEISRVVRRSWEEPVHGSPIFVVHSKLKRLKGQLREWARETFPHVDHEINCTRGELEQIQGLLDAEGFSEALFEREVQARHVYNQALELQEKLWGEKSREKWMKFGDRCSKYFHLTARMRRVKNTIRDLDKEDGSALMDQKEISDHLVDHFENFFKSGGRDRDAALLTVIPTLVTDQDNAMLSKIPSHDEIRTAIFDLDPSSAPGPDGYPGTFFRACWNIISRDVCRGIQSFFREGIVTKGVNCNFLCLIPKVENAKKVGQFRPLCLGNFFFKIIPKIMAIRLSSILHKLISSEQGAFQKSRVIFENIGVASELTNLLDVKCRGGGMSMKLDIQKAFDTLEWSFLFDVLSAFGFSQLWINWVHQILKSTRISILINGGPAGFFGMERGLRQGDPLSPLLFILSEEVLCRGLSDLRNRGWINALAGPRQVRTPSHLLYADDLFIFMKAKLANIRRVKRFLEAYGEYSGQVINLAKSKVFFGRIPTNRRQRILSVLQIPVCTFPTKYLGVFLKKGRVKQGMIQPLVDQFKSRLASWKGRLLSMAGRVELVRTVMGSIPVHNFSVYLWPVDTIEVMERWIRNFIWTGDADCSKAITVRWDSLCKPKKEGGLGVRRLRDLNLALIAKLAWTIYTDQSTFATFLRGHLVKADGTLKTAVGTSTLLPGLRRVWDFIRAAERWVVGTGNSVNFWYDKWIHNQSIEDLVLPLHIPPNLSAKVAEFWEDGSWVLPAVQEPEIQNVFTVIQGSGIACHSRPDMRFWAHSSTGRFTVKTAWAALRIKAATPKWVSDIWNRDLLPRTAVFGWRLAHGVLPTDHMVCRKAVPLASRCDLCYMDCETIQHLFLECAFSRQVWMEVLFAFNQSWSGFPTIELLFSWWRRKTKAVALPKAWGALLIISCKNLWWERNRRRHENCKRTPAEVAKLCFKEVGDCTWAKGVQVKTVQDLALARMLKVTISKPAVKRIVEVRWKQPLQGWWKLNIDGSSLGNPGSIGAGGIIRDHLGAVLRCFSQYQGVGSNYMAELGAFFTGVGHAREMGAENIWIECDSEAVVSTILSSKLPWYLMNKWWKASSFLDTIRWRITHCYREAKSAADALATHAAKRKCTTCWTSPPHFIMHTVYWEALERPFYRFT
ncbi:uncharacterized protein LOC122665876 [Telopea speciosissima]|uniref:uncharacterized protein LOC122665876 n=1 Tax=Telopea speciosissima TaxID=54955 RepID=UPI001CC73B05|nr:uncharacterized protein LOC122665876 [Telopea speciosissima]